ncbi:hypothetical protein EDD16DRAFT_1639952 [Pisolithus croceorrhizus]|nr:hypothetical protein EDD16DRAFT_1639952 [Pisolithus croceorrhizus]
MCMMPLAFFLGATALEINTISLPFPISSCRHSKVGATTTHRIAEGQFTGLISVSWCLCTENPTAATARAHASRQVQTNLHVPLLQQHVTLSHEGRNTHRDSFTG